MTNTKRFGIAAVTGALALMLAMAATLFIPANIQKAHAMTPYLEFSMTAPQDEGYMDYSKYTKAEVTDTSPMLYAGTLSAEGSWARENGWSASQFHPGISYVYTLTLKADAWAGVVEDSEFALRANGCNLTFNAGKLSTDGKTLTFTSKPYVFYNTSAISTFKVMEKTSTDVRLYILVDDLDNCAGVKIYVGNKMVKNEPVTYAPNLYPTIKIPYGVTEKCYARAYDEFGHLGAPSATINVSRPLLPSPAPVVTKINKNKVSIVWWKPNGASGAYIYANGKKIKTLSGSKKAFMYSKKGAAKMKYTAVTYVNDGGKSWPSPKSKTATVGANKKTGVSPSPSYYGYTLKNYLNMSGLNYTNKSTSTGRLKAKFTVTNTWKFVSTQTVKAKIKIKTASGKKIASQTFTVYGVKPWSKKVFTVYFNSAKTGQDLRTATMDYSIQVIR